MICGRLIMPAMRSAAAQKRRVVDRPARSKNTIKGIQGGTSVLEALIRFEELEWVPN